jgi:acyl dehydratase
MNEVWTRPAVERDTYMQMVGTEVGVSSWHLVDQKRIDAFADVTEDHQFIHVDPERALRETPFGSTVAHGFLTVSLLSVFSYEALPKISGATRGVNYGFDRLRSLHAHGGETARGRRAGVANQRQRRNRRRSQAGAGRRLDRPDLFCLRIQGQQS